MSQSRAVSFVEASVNVVAGLALALLTQAVAFPLVGVEARPAQHLRLALIFTLVSLARSYGLRRLFVHLERGAVR